jgi:hypothetical protein
MKPEPLTDEQIEEHRELWLTTKHGSVNVTEAQIFARAIEAAVNAKWEAMLATAALKRVQVINKQMEVV